jgi:hypothetical protein
VATLGLLAQVARRTFRSDPFWSQPTRVLADLGLAVTGVLTVGFGVVLLLTPAAELVPTSPVAGLAAALVAVTWLVAVPPMLACAALSASASVALFTGRQDTTAIALSLLGGTAVLAAPWFQRRPEQLWAVAFVAMAPLAATESWAVAAATGAVGALVIAVAAVRASAIKDPLRAFELAMLSLVPLAAGGLIVGVTERWFELSLGLVVVCGLMGLVLDRATPEPGETPLAVIPRVGMVSVLLLGLSLQPREVVVVAGLVLVLSVLDSLRLSEPLVLLGAGCAAPVALVGLALDAGWTVGQASIVVTASSLVWLGLSGSLSERWAPPALISAIIAGGAGLAIGAADPVAFWTNLLVIGAAALAVGLLVDQTDVALVGLGLMSLGFWGRLELAHVEASEAYVAPISLFLLIAGLRNGKGGSWLTMAPAVALLGGAGLVERFDGGSAWHAALAGAVGVAAVAAGGTWRLAGPLLTGTLLVVVTTVHETLGVTAKVDTWQWLAAGGTTLLTAAFFMERHGVGPLESGRRLVDVINDRFS